MAKNTRTETQGTLIERAFLTMFERMERDLKSVSNMLENFDELPQPPQAKPKRQPPPRPPIAQTPFEGMM